MYCYLHFRGKGEIPWPKYKASKWLSLDLSWSLLTLNSALVPLNQWEVTIHSVHTKPKSQLVFLKIWWIYENMNRTTCIRSTWKCLLKMQTLLPHLWPIAPESQTHYRQFLSPFLYLSIPFSFILPPSLPFSLSFVLLACTHP